MLTKWGKGIIAGRVSNLTEACIPVVTMSNRSILSSSNFEPAFYNRFSTEGLDVNNSSARGFVLGSGSSPENELSYSLDSQYLSDEGISASAVMQAPVYNDTSDSISKTMLITITNSSGDTKTVGEVGLRIAPAEADSKRYGVLLDRTVLDEPIDIPPSGSATIEYTITIDLS